MGMEGKLQRAPFPEFHARCAMSDFLRIVSKGVYSD